ncbi:DUF4429 domain-containing protein [Hoyosella sp. G463]|uniref:DUF4429 domain-containing protein n=1 Tax=Lolliginicoccus lacisalsi TaxID=2742202 RepID=A0A927JD77_9ACTN|nr:DUF4429 domain-containing protein [Lolliginicoccus lacisalsi]MBD8506968.1 DUF4429 domain-containing protein [Lolliginicoccus lacisalsi]
MYELRGRDAVWTIDTDTVTIEFHAGRRSDPFYRGLGRLSVPVAFIEAVQVQPGQRRDPWVARLRLAPGLDPFASAGAALSPDRQPFALVGEGGTDELVARFHADAIMQAAEFARDSSPGPISESAITSLVPAVPFHVQTWEGTASCDSTSVTLTWPGARIPSPKQLHQRKEIALADLARAEWVPRDGDTDAILRLVPREPGREALSPRNDLHCLLGRAGEEEARLLLMAATITAHARAAEQANRQDTAPASATSVAPSEIYDRIRELGKLRADGILTDAEFSAKKKELLERL